VQPATALAVAVRHLPSVGRRGWPSPEITIGKVTTPLNIDAYCQLNAVGRCRPLSAVAPRPVRLNALPTIGEGKDSDRDWAIEGWIRNDQES
jgi:hypothetical protein